MSLGIRALGFLLLSAPLASADCFDCLPTYAITSGSGDLTTGLQNLGDSVSLSLVGPSVSFGGGATADTLFPLFTNVFSPGAPLPQVDISRGVDESFGGGGDIGGMVENVPGVEGDVGFPGGWGLEISSLGSVPPDTNGAFSVAVTVPFTLSLYVDGLLDDQGNPVYFMLTGQGTETINFEQVAYAEPNWAYWASSQLTFTPTPEPGTWVLTSLGLTGVGCILYRRKRKYDPRISERNNS
jgi:hypothetical protein